MNSESKLGMLLALVLVVMFAVIHAGPKSADFNKTPTPPGSQGSPRLEVPFADV